MQEYIDEIDNMLTNEFGIGINDCTNLDAIEDAFRSNESVDDFVDGIAQKRDLIRLYRDC